MRNPLSYGSPEFEKTLRHYIDEKLLHSADSVVNLGCGDCKEGEALNVFHGNNITHFDIDAEQIIKAKEKHTDYQYRFVRQDATNLDQYMSNSVDITYLLHPNAADSVTQDLLSEAQRILKNDGLLFSCTYMRVESAILNRRIYKAGLTTTLTEENSLFEYPTFSTPLLDTGAYRFITLAHKKPIGIKSKISRVIFPTFLPKLI